MCDGHRRCTRHPVFAVQLHRMDLCDQPGADARYCFCPACTSALAYRITEMLAEIADVLPLECKTCGRPVGQLHDMLDVEYATHQERFAG